MSKRQAGLQITKDREEEEEDWGRDGPPDPVVQASAEVLATRKIAMPRSRRRPAGSAVEESKAPNPFSFTSSAPASNDGSSSANINPFSALAQDSPAASNPFGALTTGAGSTTPVFSFGGNTANASPVPTPATTSNPPAESTLQVVPTSETKSSTTNETVTTSSSDSEFDRLLRLRSINACFETAIKTNLENDPFADLTTICKEYQSYRESLAKVPIEAAKGTNGTSIYPSFKTEENKSSETQGPSPTDAESRAAAAPSFAFNASAPAFSFKAPADGASGSTFKFGESSAKPAEKDPSTTPAFTFGQTSKSDSKTESAQEKETSAEPSTTAKPNDFSWTPDRGIKFGDSSKSETKAPAPVFNFNNPLASPSQDAPAVKSDAKPASTGFSFGSSGSTGFSFGQASAPVTESKDAESDSAATKPAFSFGSANPTFSFGQSTTPTFSFSAPQKSAEPAKEPNNATSEEKTAAAAVENDGEAMPEEPRTNDALIAGPGAGEEDEDEIYTIPKVKLYKFNSEAESGASPWTDMGVCIIKVLVHKESKKARIIARSEGAGALRLNARMYPHFKYSQEGKNHVKIPDLVSSTKTETYLVKSKDKEVALKLVEVLNENKA